MAKKIPQNIIGRTRQQRTNNAIFVTFDMEQIPTVPRPQATKQLKVKFIGDAEMKAIRDRFKERPAWTKNGLQV